MIIAVSNTGPLIHIALIDQLELLFKIFDVIYIPGAVYKEAIEDGLQGGHPDAILLEKEVKIGRIIVKEVTLGQNVEIITNNLHEGEVEAIELALSTPGRTILLDDEEARVYARKMKLRVMGTVGIIIENFKQGQVTKVYATKCIKHLNQIMYLSSDVYRFAMEQIG
ncbi:MAG: hypothetical protein ACXAEU_10755 [Candidatus Hodarchaeales archaeon]|jgi:predicted nucleic acid-binding protein